MFNFDSGVLVPMMIFMIPIVAIAGGITAGIVRMLGQMRMMELARRERIAAIERGVDPEKLPPLPLSAGQFDDHGNLVPHEQLPMRRAQGLLIGGIVTLAVGIGIALMMRLLPDEDARRTWAVGLIPMFVGVGLLLSSFLVRRSDASTARGPQSPTS